MRVGFPRAGDARRWPPGRWLAELAACALLSGCATYTDSFGVVESRMAAQDYEAALQTLDRQRGPARDEVLYLLNRAMLLRMKGDLAASNEAFEAAKVRMDQLYATSVSEQTLSFVINDATRSYVGEEHEQVLLHLFEALNYLELHDLDDAHVEILQVDVKLREIGEKFRENPYTVDAFAQYLSGLIYEDLGEWSDAMIAYRDAYQGYRKYARDYSVAMPQALKYDLLRLAQREGLYAELDKYEKEFGITRFASVADRRDQGELVFVLEDGLAPIKRERAVTVPDPTSVHIVRIALPYYESRAPGVDGARVQVLRRSASDAPDATASTSTELVEDVDAIARRSLDAKMPGITARAVARAAAKRAMSLAAQQAGRSGNDRNDALAGAIVGLGVELAGLLTERADTRSWLTLPYSIQVARATLPPGEYTIKVDFTGPNGEILGSREYAHVRIEAGRRTYLSHHWIGPPGTSTRR